MGISRRTAVVRRNQGNLAAEPGERPLVVADQVLTVRLVTLLVIVGARLGVVAVIFHDRPRDAYLGVGDRDGGLLMLS